MEFVFNFYTEEKVSIKDFIPAPVKLQLKLIQRSIRDSLSGLEFAQERNSKQSFPYYLDRQQTIKQTETSHTKKKNLIRATERIEMVQINPEEIFSFWKVVGKPTLKRGFEEGRTIVNGELIPSVGGGLCQLSGLIYYICLEANLEIVERHNHSLDLYTESTRYTPLGSDATVVYGYKDLRIRNNGQHPVKFSFSVTDGTLSVRINSTHEIEKYDVEFESSTLPTGHTEVITSINGIEKVKSRYLSGSSV